MSIRATEAATDAVYERRGFASMESMLVAAFLAIMVVGGVTDLDVTLRISFASLLHDMPSVQLALH